jgi:hypothetical protein
MKNVSGIKEKGFDFGSIKIWHVGVGLICLIFLIATFGGHKIDDPTRPYLPMHAKPITDAESVESSEIMPEASMDNTEPRNISPSVEHYNNAEQRYISPSGVHYKYDLSNPADRVQIDHDMGYYGGGSLRD